MTFLNKFPCNEGGERWDRAKYQTNISLSITNKRRPLIQGNDLLFSICEILLLFTFLGIFLSVISFLQQPFWTTISFPGISGRK